MLWQVPEQAALLSQVPDDSAVVTYDVPSSLLLGLSKQSALNTDFQRFVAYKINFLSCQGNNQNYKKSRKRLWIRDP